MYARWLLTALLVWPAVAAVAILIAPPRWAKHLGFVASLIEFAIAVPLWWTFVPSGGMQFVCDAPWIQVPLFGTGAPWSIHYTVGVDGISLFMVLLTTLLVRSEEHTSELQSRLHLVCRLLLEKKKKTQEITLLQT